MFRSTSRRVALATEGTQECFMFHVMGSNFANLHAPSTLVANTREMIRVIREIRA